MTSYFRDRTEARALQEALERYDALLANGSDPAAARAAAWGALGPELRRAFALATALPHTKATLPEPDFADALEARLRRAALTPAPVVVLRRRPRFQFALAAAAAIVVFASLLVPALHSLPGDPLYALKTTSEGARILVASGPGEAKVRIAFANERFREVEQLVARTRLRMVGVGTVAAGITEENLDPEVTALIRATLLEAEHQIARAAAIIIETPQTADTSGLEQLVAVSRRGQDLAENVATVVAHDDKSPMLKTVVTLARIEAQANAARMTTPTPTPTPCVTATPEATTNPDEPTASPTDTPDATPVETPAATPEGTATPAPCVTPTPSPTATPGGDRSMQTPEPSVEPTPDVTQDPGSNAGGDPGQGSSTDQSQSSNENTTDAMSGPSSG